MQAEANKEANVPGAPTPPPAEPQGSFLKTFALVAAITLVILGGIGFAVWHMGSSDLPMNYPGFDNK